MISSGQRRDPVRLLWKRLFTLGLFFLVLFALWAVWGVYWKERESRDLRELAETQLQDLKERQATLSASIGALDSARGKEQALRGAYEVGREGEGLVVIVDQSPASTSAPTSTQKHWIQRFFWR